jgi:signal transduction histidine kinase
MRFAPKLTCGFAALCVATAVAAGAFELARERDHLVAGLEHELRLIGTSVVVSLEDAQRDGDPGQIEQHLASIERADPSVDVAIVRSSGAVDASSPGMKSSAGLEETSRRAIATAAYARLVEDAAPEAATDAASGRLVVALPYPEGVAAPQGAVVVTRPLDEVEAHLRSARNAVVGSSLLLFGTTTVLLFLFVRWNLSRPLQALSAAMQRVMAGDLTARTQGADDEVGSLARQFEAMVGELSAARGRLAEAVESRATLERGLQRLDKLATLGQLSAGLAHEIGSPLQVMQGRTRALLSDRARDPDEVRRIATIVNEQADRITRIVEQLLRFARRTPPPLAAVALEAPVRAVLDLLEHAARQGEVALELDAAPGVPRVRADVDGVQQVVLNLVKNALEATARGGRITVLLRPTETSGADGRARAGARLEVVDSGCGMSEATLARLFEPFFTTRAALGGSGLGLAVVRSIVVAHGGTVVASTVAGVGSRFTVDLPAVSEAAADADAPAPLDSHGVAA